MDRHWETQKKIWEKRVGKEQVVQPNGTSWHKLEYVEQVEQVEAGLQIYMEQVEQEQGGLQIDVEQVEQGQGVYPPEPLHLCQSGSTRPWTFLNSGGGSSTSEMDVPSPTAGLKVLDISQKNHT